MKKAVLFSIKPKHCEQIISGKKTVEVRKRIPKISVPFTAYIYETKGRKKGTYVEIPPEQGGGTAYKVLHEGRGAVIGEFVCNRVDKIGKRGIDNNFDYCYLSLNKFGNDDVEIEIMDIKKSCISKDDLNKYGADVPLLYALHISDLVIYEEPKDLSEFIKIEKCPYAGLVECFKCNRHHCLTRPPQSWCYVEKLRGVG